MTDANPPPDGWADFEDRLKNVNPAFYFPLRIIRQDAPASLKEVQFVQSVFSEQNSIVKLMKQLQEELPASSLAPTTENNTPQCNVWSSFGALLMLQGKQHQAVEVFDALYKTILDQQKATGTRYHKGSPLFHMSQCYQNLRQVVHAKRYMMLALCEDAITCGGQLNLRTTGTYGPLAWVYGLSDQQIKSYAKNAFEQSTKHPLEIRMPEWVLQQLDQNWKTEIPSAQETGLYHISRQYCELLMSKLGATEGKALELLAEYLIGAMPGCRTHRRARTYSTDFDIVASVEGPIADFRSELGRYFVCECKDNTTDKASFTDIAKFCRVLDSVKARFGIVFSTTGYSGEGEAENADREILKVYQDRGIVIVVVDREDLQRVAEGMNFISLLREKYERVRLDLRSASQ